MGFTAFIGRVLFVPLFIISALQEYEDFGVDGGPTARAFGPKYNALIKRVSSFLGWEPPHIEVKELVAVAIALKGIGGILFVFESPGGAYLLLAHLAFTTPIMYDFYNYNIRKPEFAPLFSKFIQNLSLIGALVYFIGMKHTSEEIASCKAAQASVFWRPFVGWFVR